MNRVAIVIVSFNTRADLEACLASLAGHPPAVSHEIVVVDNGSQDGGPEAIRRHWPAVRVIDAGANLGFARATNLGIRATEGSLLLLLNSDTIVPPGAVDTLVARLVAHPEAAIAAPRLVDEQGVLELSFGRMMGPWNEARQKVLARGYASRWPFVRRYVERLASREQHPEWVSGACLLVWRADADAVGLLDERYFLYGEDVDFCAAIRRRGRRVLFTPAAVVVHRGGRSRLTQPAASEAAYRRSQLAFYTKHHPRWLPLLRAYLKVRGRLPRD